MQSNIYKSDLQKIEHDLNQVIIKLLLKISSDDGDNENKEDLIKQINSLSKSVPQLIKLSEKISNDLQLEYELEANYKKILGNEEMLEKSIEIINFLNI